MEQLGYLTFLGLFLSIYALNVEIQSHKDKSYHALCDSSSGWYSCTQVFNSPPGHLLSYWNLVSTNSILNIPNAALGVIFYTAMLISQTSFPSMIWLQQSMSTMAVLASIYLLYVLVFVLKDICLVCLATHLINFSLATILYRTPMHINLKQQ